MSVLLITYDLNKEKKSKDGYEGLYKVIKSYSWARLSESSYAISTYETPQTVYDKLRPSMDGDDNLLVMTLTTPYRGYNRKDVIDWLTAQLPQ